MQARGGRGGRNNEGQSCGQLCRGVVASAVSLVVGKRWEQETPAAKRESPARGWPCPITRHLSRPGRTSQMAFKAHLPGEAPLHPWKAGPVPSPDPAPSSKCKAQPLLLLPFQLPKLQSLLFSVRCFLSFQSSSSLSLKIVYVNSPQYRCPDIAGLRAWESTHREMNSPEEGAQSQPQPAWGSGDDRS